MPNTPERDYSDRVDTYYRARAAAMVKTRRLLAEHQLLHAAIFIDKERPGLWEGLHEIMLRTGYSSETVLIDHGQFMEPVKFDVHVMPLLKAALVRIQAAEPQT